jgi:hypothetical protein
VDWEEFDEARLALEEVFQVDLSETLMTCTTLGEVFKLIETKRAAVHSNADWAKNQVLSDLRVVFKQQLGLSSEAVTEESELRRVFPWYRRRRMWNIMSRELEWNLPSLLDVPGAIALAGVIFLVLSGVGFAGIAALDDFLGWPDDRIMVLALPVFAAAIAGAYLSGRLLQCRLPDRQRTVADLVNSIVTANPDTLMALEVPRSECSTGTIDGEMTVDSVRAMALERLITEVDRIGKSSVEGTTAQTSTNTRFPFINRRKRWRRLERALGWVLPPLERPGLVVFLGVCLYLVMVVALFVFGDQPWWVVLAGLLVPTLMFAWLFHWVTIPLALMVPEKCETIGALADRIALFNYGHIALEYRVSSRDEAWSMFLEVVAEVTGFPEEELTAETSIDGNLLR